MNSGQSSTELNDMLTQFTEYVYSFYGAPDALYPMGATKVDIICLLYTSPSPRDLLKSRMPSSA